MKKINLITWLISILALLNLNAFGQNEHWKFNFANKIEGEIFDMIKSPADGKIYICGGFLSVSGNRDFKNLVRYDPKTGLMEQVPGINRYHSNFIRCMAVDKKGDIYVGGDFKSIGGIQAGKIAKFEVRTGQWKPLKDPNFSASDQIDGPSSGGVYALAVSDKYVYIGGYVFNHPEKKYRYIRQFNLKTRKWEALGDGVGAAFRERAMVKSMVLDGKGNLYVGGAFSLAGGKQVENIARWDGRSWHALGKGTTGTHYAVLDMKMFNGKLVISGSFTKAGDVNANGIALWDGRKWHGFAGGIARKGNLSVYSLDITPKGIIYIGGFFDTSADGSTPMKNVAVFYNDAWHGLGKGLGRSTTQGVNAVLVDGDDVYFGGMFAKQTGSPNVKQNFAIWNWKKDFTKEPAPKTFRPKSGSPNAKPAIKSELDDSHWFFKFKGNIAVEPFDIIKSEIDNKIYFCGGFLEVGGNRDMHNLVKYDPRTNTWEQVPGIDRRHSGFIRCMAEDKQGNIYVGGDFTSIGGIKANKVAKFNVRTGKWSALADPTFFEANQTTGPDRGGVYAIEVVGDYVYIGGWKFNCSRPEYKNIRRFNTRTKKWEAVGKGVNAKVAAFAKDPRGNLYVGGVFDMVDGKRAQSLAKWDGRTWHVKNTGIGGKNKGIYEMQYYKGKLYMVGAFSKAGGKHAQGVAAFDGRTWETFASGVDCGGIDFSVQSLSFDSDGKLYIGGFFNMRVSDNQKLNNAAVWNGTKWVSLGTGLGKSTTQGVNAVFADGKNVYFGGVFSKTNGSPNRKVNQAVWNENKKFQ